MPPKKAYESYESESELDDKNFGKSDGKKQKLDKDSDDYKQRRERNNVAVRKSREASRKKAKTTIDRVKKLREENEVLEQKVTILNKELGVLRDLFLSHASATSEPRPASETPNKNNSTLNSNEDHLNNGDQSSALMFDHKYVLKD